MFPYRANSGTKLSRSFGVGFIMLVVFECFGIAREATPPQFRIDIATADARSTFPDPENHDSWADYLIRELSS